MNKAELALRIENLQKFYWCDSTIVLAWIAGEPVKWKTFVANRVTKIQNYTTASQWRHVRTKLNPADTLSRGAMPRQLLAYENWWLGPQYLKLNPEFWPESEHVNIEETTERRKTEKFALKNTRTNQYSKNTLLL